MQRLSDKKDFYKYLDFWNQEFINEEGSEELVNQSINLDLLPGQLKTFFHTWFTRESLSCSPSSSPLFSYYKSLEKNCDPSLTFASLIAVFDWPVKYTGFFLLLVKVSKPEYE